MPLTKALLPVQKQQQRRQPHPRTHGHRTRGDGSANQPVSSKEQKLLLYQEACARKRSVGAAPNQSESVSTSTPPRRNHKHATANTSNSKLPNKLPVVPPRSATTVATVARTRTAQAALAESCKKLGSWGATNKRLMFVPMSAWVNNAGEDDAISNKLVGASVRNSIRLLTGRPADSFPDGRDPTNKRGVRWPKKHVHEESSIKSVSTFEQQFSLDCQSTPGSLSLPPKVETQDQPSSSFTRTPHPGQTSSASSPSPSSNPLVSPQPSPPPRSQPPPQLLPPPWSQPPLQLPPPPRSQAPLQPPPPPRSLPTPAPPSQLLPPPLPPRTASTGHRHVLRHPSDVAALLHEVLKNSSGLGEKGEKIPVVQVSKTKKSNSAAPFGSSQDSGILDALVRIIADRISSGDHQKDDKKGKVRHATSLDQLKVNRALLATGERNGTVGDGSSDKKKPHELCKKQPKCHSGLQQNCSNCYEKPVKKVRYLNHHSHRSRTVCSDASPVPNRILRCPRKSNVSDELDLVENENLDQKQLHDFELLAEKLRASEQQFQLVNQQQCRPSAQRSDGPVSIRANSSTYIQPTVSFSNGSNASELFFERVDPHLSNWKSISKCDPAPSSASPVTDGRRVQHRSPTCCSVTDNDLTKCQRSDRVITSTGTCSTEDETFVQQNVSVSKVQAHRHPYPIFDSVDWHETTEGVSLISSCSRAAGTTVDSPTLTDKSQVAAGKQPREYKPCADNMSFAVAESEYTQQLFGCLLKSRDESGFVRPLDSAPDELNLWSIHHGASPGNSENGKLLQRSPLKIFVPELTFRSKREESTSKVSSDALCIAASDLFNGGDIRRSIPPPNVGPEKRSQLDSLASPQVHSVVELPPAECLPYLLAECFDGAANSMSRRSHQAIHKSRRTITSRCSQPDYRTVWRSSRIHVVEPLADAVQQKIELPTGIVEKHFSSWRPIKYTQLVRFIVPIFSIESIFETFNQPVSLFCHSSGSVITADSNVTTTTSRGGSCYGTESIVSFFARRIAFRIIENFEIQNVLFDSSTVAGLLNQSLIKPDRRSFPAHCIRGCGCSGLRQTTDIDQYWQSGSYQKGSARSAIAPGKRSGRLAIQDIEFRQVTTNLAERFRRAKRHDRHPHCCYHRCRGSGASRISCASDTEPEILLLDSSMCRLRPEPLFQRPCAAIADVNFVTDECTQLECGDCVRIIVTHCPELVTNPNLALVSVTSDTDESYAMNSGPPEYTIDTATSDYMSGDTTALRQYAADPSYHYVGAPNERTTDAFGERLHRASELHSLAVDCKHLDLLPAGEVQLLEQHYQQKHNFPTQYWHQPGGARDAFRATDVTWGGWTQADLATQKCFCQDATSRGTDLTQRRSYSSHSYRPRTAAVLPVSVEDQNGVLLNITCQLTVVDQVVDSSSFDGSISTDGSELVCA